MSHPLITAQVRAMMERQALHPNLTESIVFTLRDGTDLDAQNVMIAKATQQQANAAEFIAMGLQVVNVIGKSDLQTEVGATFSYDGKLWEVREPTVIGTNSIARTTIATASI